MKLFNIEEVKAVQSNQNYKYLGLFDQSGTQIIPFNPAKVSGAERLRQIETRLISQGLKDGIYIIKGKNSVGKTVPADEYFIQKGSNLSELSCDPVKEVQIVEKPTFQPEVLTYQGALALQIELERYKLENKSLQKEIDSLKADIKELEQESQLLSEEEKPSLMENAQTFLTNAMQFVAPLLDKHFELKEKQLGLQAIQIQHRLGDFGKPVKPQATKEAPLTQHPLEVFISQYKNDPETFNALAEIYNTATSEEDFLKGVNDYDNEIYNALLNYGK